MTPTDHDSAGRGGAGIPRPILALFLLSGAAGLIYQVVWARMLTLVFGATVLAVSTVLTVFMLGLAAGSAVFGRRADRPGADLLRLYGRLELGIGLYCAATPFLITLVRKVYVAASPSAGGGFMGISLIRFALCVAVLAVPTFLMGGTLPILAKFTVRRFDALGKGVGTLYAVNTAGAVIGSFLTGYLLIALAGVRATIGIAVVVNCAVGLAAMALARRGITAPGGADPAARPADPHPGAAHAAGRGHAAGALVLLLVSGLCALVYEVAWTRLLSQILGSSVYALAAMLTTFLTGIAAGSWIVTRRADRTESPARLLALVQIGIGVTALVATPLLDRLPLLFIRFAGGLGTGFAAASIVHFLFSALVMILPTLLMGASFPLAARIYARDAGRVGSAIGTVYSWNTIGAIAGAFLGGFVLIPLLGMQKTILAASALNIVAGSLYLLAAPRTPAAARFLIPAGAIAGVVALFLGGADWDRYLLNFGAFDSPGYYRQLIREKGLKDVLYSYDMRFYKEGLNSNVAVSQEGESLFLQINGRTEASTASDMQNQLLAAHIPLLLHPNPQTACLIGLGSGITLGSMLLHPLQQVDCVEISPEVVEAASYFAEFDYNALADPRVRIIQDDGRNFLLASQRKYDVLISEPSKPWITGVSNLFTRDYYRTCLSRLDEDGIMCQWCHYYSMSPEDFRTIVRTFSSVFPYVQMWNVGRDVFLLGSRAALPIDMDLLGMKYEDERIRFDLARIGIRNLFGFVSLFMLADNDLREYIGAGPLNTDDHPIIEFSAPRNLSVYKQEEIYRSMLQFRPRYLSYPLLRQITELANGRGFAYPLSGMQYLTPDKKLVPRVAGIVRTLQPEPDSTGAPVVSFRREAFFDVEGAGGVAFAAIEKTEYDPAALDSSLSRVMWEAQEWGDAKVRDHPARWVLRKNPASDEMLLALSWSCIPNTAQFLVTRMFEGRENAPAMLEEMTKSCYCYHRGEDQITGKRPL